MSDEPIDRKFESSGINLDPEGVISKRIEANKNVIPFQKPDDCIAAITASSDYGLDVSVLVDMLEECGGSLDALAALCPYEPNPKLLVFRIEKLLKADTDKDLYRRWKAAKKLNLTVRISFLQSEALKKLENPESTILKLSEVVAYAKLILGDVLASQIMAAKKPVVIDKDGNTIEPDDDDDDAAAERAMAGA